MGHNERLMMIHLCCMYPYTDMNAAVSTLVALSGAWSRVARDQVLASEFYHPSVNKI